MIHYARPYGTYRTAAGTRRAVGIWLALMTLLTAQLLVCAWCRIQCRQVGYEISEETDHYQKLLAIQHTLKIEVERLRSPERITRIALHELDLTTPLQSQKRYIPFNETY